MNIDLASSDVVCAVCGVDIFRSVLSLPWPANRLDNRTLSIINSPEITTKHSYVNRPFLDVWTKELATGDHSPGSRRNPLYATLAGKGKGKTRFFVELEKALNGRSEQDVLAVAITFNGAFSEVVKFDEEDARLSMAVEVVLRILTMAYSIQDFHRFRREFTEALSRFRRHERVGHIRLLQECVKYLVEDVERQRSRPCKKFVLLVDEPKHMVEEGIHNNTFDQLRHALLDYEMPGFHVSMAMTALDTTPLGVSMTGRPLLTMPLPTTLDVDEMYREWLPAYLPQLTNLSLVDPNTEAHLKQLLSLTAPVPRTTEILVSVLARMFPADQPLPFTEETTARVLKELFQGVEDRYTNTDTSASFMLDNARLVYSILWREKLDWNVNINRAMIDGYLVSPPSEVSTDMDYPPVLSALSLCRLHRYLTPTMTLLKPVVEATMNIACNASAYHHQHDLGRPLALLGNAFLTCKVLSAERVSHGNYSLYRLLGCEDCLEPCLAHFDQFMLTLTTGPHELEDLYHATPLPSSYANINKHVDALRQCQLMDRSVLVVKGHDKEGWDGLWVLRQTNGQPFVLVVAYAFHELRGHGATATGGRHRVSNHQAKRFRTKIVTACQAAFPSTSEYDGSAAAAIAAGDFAFVYIDTAASPRRRRPSPRVWPWLSWIPRWNDDESRVFADDDHFLRLTGSAASEVFSDAGRQILEIVRRSAMTQELSQSPDSDR